MEYLATADWFKKSFICLNISNETILSALNQKVQDGFNTRVNFEYDQGSIVLNN